MNSVSIQKGSEVQVVVKSLDPRNSVLLLQA